MTVTTACNPDSIKREPRSGKPMIEDRTYLRSSSLSSALKDQSGLITWKAKMVVAGLRVDPTLLSTEMSEYHISERAAELGGSGDAAAAGTAIHDAISEYHLHGVIPAAPDHAAVVEALTAKFDEVGAEVIASELFVVSDRFSTAGTLDAIIRIDGVDYIADYKTSASRNDGKHPLGVAVQAAQYATGRPYCSCHGYGEPLSVSQDYALLIELPLGTTDVFMSFVDLNYGREAADLALRVLNARAHEGQVLVREIA